MRTKLIRNCLAAAILIGSAAEAMTAGSAFTRGCAARDIQLVMMLDAGAIAPQKLNDVVRTMRRARSMCFDGHVVDALALYDDIAQSITSDWSLAGQGP
jgi:hypothetical protein